MALWTNIKAFLNKQDYDFERPDTNLHNFHPQLLACFAINGVFFNNKKSPIRFVVPVLNIMLGLVATGFEMMLIYRGVTTEDYAFASESFCYVVILGTVPILYSSTLLQWKHIMELTDRMNGDFLFIAKLGPPYQPQFLKGQLLIWKLCCAWFVFTVSIALLYIANTAVLLLYQSLLATQYTYVYALFHILIHYYLIMEMIDLELDTMFEGFQDMALPPPDHPVRTALKARFYVKIKRIVDWHNSVFDGVEMVSSVYGPPLMYQVMFSSVAICIMAYQVADQLEQGILDYLFAALLIAACVQLWIPCYLGSIMRNKAFAVGDKCFTCGWERTPVGLLLRTELTIIILRSQRPLTIEFTCLPSLTLETFSSIMSTSYSYFNMLRQSTR